MGTKSLAEALDGKVSQITKVLAVLVQEQAFTADLHALRVLLMDVLDLLERHSGIEAAADDLYEVASAFVAARSDARNDGRLTTRERMLAAAFTRYRDRLTSARPSAQARAAGLI